ncbi:MAG: hypothetical protein VB861_14310, partial [Planctomycetaceae bacterium]
MHATEFASAIDGQGVPPVVVLVGSESLLVRQSARAITREIFGTPAAADDSDTTDDDLSRRNGDQVLFRDIRDELATVSMFATHRVVLVEG